MCVPYLDARWFTREEILAVLRHHCGTNFSRRDYKKMAEIQDGPDSNADTKKVDISALAHSDPCIKVKEASMAKPREQAVEFAKNNEPPFRMPAFFFFISILLSFAERALCRTLLANSKGPQCPCASLSSRVP